MIEEKLEIVLITYNRSKDLTNTFKQLLKSPFNGCKITILDNCSDDETPAVCAKYQKLFPNMKIVRHPRNIGGNPNILRAVETSKSLYTWILCDDDNYDFSDCSDVIDAINSENFDLISLGAPGQFDWERGLTVTSEELIERGARYFRVFSFVPGFIFKTALFDSLCTHKGYFNVHNLYPHFPFINKSLEENYLIYISKKRIVNWGNHNIPGFSSLYYLLAWINSCIMIKDKKIRKKAVYDDPHGVSLIKIICVSIMMEKMTQKNACITTFSLISALILAFGFSKDLLLLLLILPLAIVPKLAYGSILKIYLYLKYDIRGKKVPEALKAMLFDENRFNRLRY